MEDPEHCSHHPRAERKAQMSGQALSVWVTREPCRGAQEASKAETACVPDDLGGKARLSAGLAGSLGGGILTRLSASSPGRNGVKC